MDSDKFVCGETEDGVGFIRRHDNLNEDDFFWFHDNEVTDRWRLVEWLNEQTKDIA